MRQGDARQRTNCTKARRRGSLPIEPPDQNGGISLPMPSSGLSGGCPGPPSVVLARHWHLPTRIRRPSPSQPRPRRQLASRAAREAPASGRPAKPPATPRNGRCLGTRTRTGAHLRLRFELPPPPCIYLYVYDRKGLSGTVLGRYGETLRLNSKEITRREGMGLHILLDLPQLLRSVDTGTCVQGLEHCYC